MDSQKPVLQLTGWRDNRNANYGLEGPLSGGSPSIVGLVIAAGDQLVFDFQQNIPSYGGLAFIFTDGNGTGSVTDTNGTGQPLYFDGESDGQWHHMAGDLSPFAGETVAYPLIGLHHEIPWGNFVMNYANAGVLHADGTFTAIYTGQPGANVTAFTGDSGGAQDSTSGTVLTPITDPSMNAEYFADDHLGTAQMEFNGGGWPIWQGQFTPFGKELEDGHTDMAFKFTGKERDKETDLDNFGARYYASHIGRWMSPDWAEKPEAVPYSSLDNPQSLNLYGYVGNNPLSKADADGHWSEPFMPVEMGPCAFGSYCPHGASDAPEPPTPESARADNQQTAQQQSAQQQAAQIPGAVKSAIMNSVNASNAPSGADTTGGFHEESGIAGTNAAGGLVVSPDQPGAYSNPDTSNHVSTTHTPVDADARNSIANVTVMWHVHPSGTTATHGWVQSPSAQDQSVVVPGPINIVVGAGNRTVYFYNGSSNVQSMSLKNFMKP